MNVIFVNIKIGVIFIKSKKQIKVRRGFADAG